MFELKNNKYNTYFANLKVFTLGVMEQNLKPIVYPVNNTDYDIEKATNNAVNNIIYTHQKNENNDSCIIKTVTVTICTIFILPFGIANVYYAFTDKSCVYIKPGKLYVNLRDYLAVQGIIYLTVYVLLVLCISCSDVDAANTYSDKPIIVKAIIIINQIFAVAWLILGAVIFWGLIDNSKCDDGIYNYMYASLIIQIIFACLDRLKK